MKHYTFVLNILFLFMLNFLSAQQKEIFNESFENNSKQWPLPNSQSDQSKIQGGQLIWAHNAPFVKSISTHLNRLNTKGNYELKVQFSVLKQGSTYGIMWGAVNERNAYFFRVKGLKYQVLETKNGAYRTIQDFKNPLKLKLNENVLGVKKVGEEYLLFINESQVYKFKASGDKGKNVGFALWENSKVGVDEFVVRGEEIPINLIQNLEYSEAPVNLGDGVNTKVDELTPIISADGKTLFFTRRYAPENVGGPTDDQDIYVSKIQNGKWQRAQNIGKPLNNHGPNAVCAVTPDGNQLLLMNTYSQDGSPRAMGLSISQKTARGWSLPKEVKMRQFYNKSTFNEFFLSNDGKTILLAVQRDDTKGSRDIYVSHLERRGVWSAPINLGSVINTPGVELSPFLASDGVTLYFSSTGHPGYGKNDIFMSRRLDDSWTKWSKPLNLGKPINTEGNDAYYSVPASGDYAYFISEKNSKGLNDIFKVKLPGPIKPKPVLLVAGNVYNSKTKKPISTRIVVYDLSTGKEVGIAYSSPGDGSYEITLPPGREYAFYAEKKGFYAVRENLNLKQVKKYGEVKKDLYLTPIEAGQAISLNNVFFVRSKAVLLPKSFPELNKLHEMMIENTGISIKLEGHTDNTGSPDLNLKLSQDRADKVKEYLVKKGIDQKRITTQGYGGEKPVASNAKEETRRLNRRVEFRIISF